MCPPEWKKRVFFSVFAQHYLQISALQLLRFGIDSVLKFLNKRMHEKGAGGAIFIQVIIFFLANGFYYHIAQEIRVQYDKTLIMLDLYPQLPQDYQLKTEK